MKKAGLPDVPHPRSKGKSAPFEASVIYERSETGILISGFMGYTVICLGEVQMDAFALE
ncbi:MAG: hypothetical protein FWH32_03490 [Clostridiales bacterium]|nr:hypothetical protein [Clostridiales bacterium]